MIGGLDSLCLPNKLRNCLSNNLYILYLTSCRADGSSSAGHLLEGVEVVPSVCPVAAKVGARGGDWVGESGGGCEVSPVRAEQ